MADPLRIATRSSRLALWQATFVASRLRERTGLATELVEVSTLGDRNRRDPLAGFQGLGVFTREVQRAVLAGDADLAVHSLKDLPTARAEGLTLAAFPVRDSRYDLLIPREDLAGEAFAGIESLPPGARVGTGSPRREAQVLQARGDLEVLGIRGNIETRLGKLDRGDYEAIILAEAGVRRLGLESRIMVTLAPPEFYPAVGQGALAVDCRREDERSLQALAAIDDPGVRAETTAERAALRELRAGCHAPLGADCEIAGDRITLRVVVFSPDGQERREAAATGSPESAEELGIEVAQSIIADGGAALLETNQE